MCSAMVARAFSWYAILKAALPRARIRLIDAMQGTMIGVLMSSTLPARLGRAGPAARGSRGRTGRPRENFPVVLGTLVSQTILNLLALAILGAINVLSVDFFNGHQDALLVVAIVPAVLVLIVWWACRSCFGFRRRGGFSRLQRGSRCRSAAAITKVREGLQYSATRGWEPAACVFQLTAVGDCSPVSCYLLLVALGLDHQAGFAAAAAVLFAVNVTAVVPVTPANLGVFQAACVAVLHTGWHVGVAPAFAYGVILQGVEVATAILMGTPALVKEACRGGRSGRARCTRHPSSCPPPPADHEPRSHRRGPRRGLAGGREPPPPRGGPPPSRWAAR